MAIQTKIIKQKIRSVANIKKITKTMEMVSVSKMRRATVRTLGSRTYAILGLKLLSYLKTGTEEIAPLMAENPQAENKELVLLYAGNKGLCGGYHVNIFKTLNSYIKTKEHPIEVITVGKYAEKIANKLKLPIVASYIDFTELSTAEALESVSRLAQEKFLAGEYRNVSICYTRFIKSTLYKPVVITLLPATTEMFESLITYTEINTEGEAASPYDFSNTKFEPDRETVINKVVPAMITVAVYQALAESHASEHSARMFAMKNAGDNASDMLDDLQLTYNNARQASITQELSEIVGGASALQVD